MRRKKWWGTAKTSLFQTKPNSTTTFFLYVLFPPPLPVGTRILKSWHWIERGHRISQGILIPNSCYWQSWEQNLGLNSPSCLLPQTYLCCTFPPQLRTTCIFWSSNTHHILKMVIPHICIVSLTLKTGQIIEFTHAISLETQMTISSNSEARNREGWNRHKCFFKSATKTKTP